MGRGAVGLIVGTLVTGTVVLVTTDTCVGEPLVAPVDAPALTPVFDGADAGRPRLPIRLVPVATGLEQPTDVQAVPGRPGLLVVLEKTGAARWLSLDDRQIGPWFQVDVLTRSEQGLLGLAFHPRFPQNGRFFVHASVRHDGDAVGEVSEWLAPATGKGPRDPRRAAPVKTRVLLRVKQPYANHDAGQLAFGPDGMLYVGFGDGGAANDPLNQGQDRRTFLGSMLRLDAGLAHLLKE